MASLRAASSSTEPKPWALAVSDSSSRSSSGWAGCEARPCRSNARAAERSAVLWPGPSRPSRHRHSETKTAAERGGCSDGGQLGSTEAEVARMPASLLRPPLTGKYRSVLASGRSRSRSSSSVRHGAGSAESDSQSSPRSGCPHPGEAGESQGGGATGAAGTEERRRLLKAALVEPAGESVDTEGKCEHRGRNHSVKMQACKQSIQHAQRERAGMGTEARRARIDGLLHKMA